MIEVSRLNALEAEDLVKPVFSLEGTAYVITEKGKKLFDEIYNSLHREAQKTFLKKVALKY
jgi:CTP-dependent riboflavin kinase